MKKFSFRVSGARVGDAVRPVADGVDALAMLPRKRLGLRAHATRLSEMMPPAPAVTAATRAFGPEDYATAEDYE